MNLQQVILNLMPPAWRADIEAESRSWMVRCPDCQTELSVWQLGGVRWKAIGNPRRWMYCP